MMNLKSWLPPAFSNFFAPSSTVRVDKEGRGFFYMIQGDRQDYPYKTLFETFRNIPHLRAVIERKATMFSNVKFKIVKTDKEDEIDYDHPLNAIFNSPNAFQSWRQMMFMISVYKSIAGIAYIYPGFGITKTAKHLAFIKNIDFSDYHVEVNQSSNAVIAANVDELIKWIQFYFDNAQSLKYMPSELIAFKDSFSSYTSNTSRITTLRLPIENIWKCMVNRGILLDKKGGIGLISGAQKDGGVSVPMTPAEKSKLNANLNNYGLGAGKEPIMLTDVPLNWQPMVFPTNQLMMFEEIEDDFNQICDTYGVHRELFFGKTPYANKLEANISTYTDTILPEWTDFFDLMNRNLNTAKEKLQIQADYSHISGLQQSEKDRVETEAKKSTMHLAELSALAIDINTYRQLMGYDTTNKTS